MNTNYPLITKLGLTVYNVGALELVSADELEYLLSDSKRVTGAYNYSHVIQPFGEIEKVGDTHTAILLCVEPIEKAVTENELRGLYEKYQSHLELAGWLKRILEHGYTGTRKET